MNDVPNLGFDLGEIIHSPQADSGWNQQIWKTKTGIGAGQIVIGEWGSEGRSNSKQTKKVNPDLPPNLI